MRIRRTRSAEVARPLRKQSLRALAQGSHQAAFALGLQSFAVHANIDVELGWLGYLVMGPAHHRLHHSTRIEEAGNFASATTVWDHLFGSFVYGQEPESVGVVKPESFPEPLAVLRNQLHPFVDQAQR